MDAQQYYTAEVHGDYQIFDLGDFAVAEGGHLPVLVHGRVGRHDGRNADRCDDGGDGCGVSQDGLLLLVAGTRMPGCPTSDCLSGL